LVIYVDSFFPECILIERNSMYLKKTLQLAAIIMIMIILAASAIAGTGTSKTGTRVFNFLKIEVAARPTAMGGAFTGVADDESSLFYNPSSITGLSGKHFIAGYHNTIFDMQSGFLGFITPVGAKGKISGYINYLNYGDFIRTNDVGKELGTFGGSDMLFAVSYATLLKENMSVGGTIKFIYEKIENYSSTGVAFDLAAKYAFSDKRNSVGVAVQNVGAQLSKFTENSKSDPLPIIFRGGFASFLQGMPVLFAADLIYPTDNKLYFALGAEYLNLKPLFLRAGWTSFGSNYKTDSNKDNLAGFSAGFGLNYKQMQISYAISPQSELGTSHRITLSGGLN
jgi:hypothetical protein